MSTLDRYSAYGPTVLRLALGSMWIAHALLKYLVFTLPGFAGFLASQGLPAFMAWPVFLLELLGGLAILAGFHGRWVSLALMPVMAVALSTHVANGWLFTNAGGGWEYPLFLLAASFAHALLGDGALAITGRGRGVSGARDQAFEPL